MLETYVEFFEAAIPARECLQLIKTEAARFAKTHTHAECFKAAIELYAAERLQIQEAGILLAGYAALHVPEALTFLRNTVSTHDNWRAQEVLAMSFDIYCRLNGYEASLPLIRDWLSDSRANVRRAVTEGLRVWTSRPWFKDHPEEAVALLAFHREDESHYVRKSAGNALRDISRKHSGLVRAELDTWDTSSKKTAQVWKLAGKFVYTEKE